MESTEWLAFAYRGARLAIYCVHLTVYHSYLPTYISTYLSNYLYIYLFIHLSIMHLSICAY